MPSLNKHDYLRLCIMKRRHHCVSQDQVSKAHLDSRPLASEPNTKPCRVDSPRLSFLSESAKHGHLIVFVQIRQAGSPNTSGVIYPKIVSHSTHECCILLSYVSFVKHCLSTSNTDVHNFIEPA